MTQNEQELIDLIRSNKDPQNAMMVAIDIICQYLKQRESSQEPSVAVQQESA